MKPLIILGPEGINLLCAAILAESLGDTEKYVSLLQKALEKGSPLAGYYLGSHYFKTQEKEMLTLAYQAYTTSSG